MFLKYSCTLLIGVAASLIIISNHSMTAENDSKKVETTVDYYMRYIKEESHECTAIRSYIETIAKQTIGERLSNILTREEQEKIKNAVIFMHMQQQFSNNSVFKMQMADALRDKLKVQKSAKEEDLSRTYFNSLGEKKLSVMLDECLSERLNETVENLLNSYTIYACLKTKFPAMCRDNELPISDTIATLVGNLIQVKLEPKEHIEKELVEKNSDLKNRTKRSFNIIVAVSFGLSLIAAYLFKDKIVETVRSY